MWQIWHDNNVSSNHNRHSMTHYFYFVSVRKQVSDMEFTVATTIEGLDDESALCYRRPGKPTVRPEKFKCTTPIAGRSVKASRFKATGKHFCFWRTWNIRLLNCFDSKQLHLTSVTDWLYSSKSLKNWSTDVRLTSNVRHLGEWTIMICINSYLNKNPAIYLKYKCLRL